MVCVREREKNSECVLTLVYPLRFIIHWMLPCFLFWIGSACVRIPFSVFILAWRAALCGGVLSDPYADTAGVRSRRAPPEKGGQDEGWMEGGREG